MFMRDGVYTQFGKHNYDAQFGEQHRAVAVQECLNLVREPRTRTEENSGGSTKKTSLSNKSIKLSVGEKNSTREESESAASTYNS
jgi:topoisomerase IA-like protein